MKDAYGREISCLRLSVTQRCNLRCRYCMPPEGACEKRREAPLTEDEMIAAVEAAASLGVTKVRVTGGEPLVKRNLLSICRRAAAVAGVRELCLTTNGTLLAPLAAPLREAGVRRVNISMDTLDAAKYASITRGGSLADALAGLEAALAAGFDRVKVNAVLLGGVNDDEIPALADLTRRYPLDVRFIELMPMRGAEPCAGFLPCARALQRLPQAQPLAVTDGVARLYRLPGALGRVGFIAPVSGSFCARCDRLRLTADGKLKPCLHSALELPLKGLDADGMREQMRRAIALKPACHGELGGPGGAGRSMNRIGG